MTTAGKHWGTTPAANQGEFRSRMTETVWEQSIDAFGVPGSVEELPAHPDTRAKVIRLAESTHRPAEVAAVIESDPALLIRTLRQANALEWRARTIASAEVAVAALGPLAVAEVAERTPVHHPLVAGREWGLAPQRYRSHVSAVRAVVERLAREAEVEDAGEVTAGVVLHDVGRLALMRAEPLYDRLVPESASPEDRLRSERGAFGVDHAELGGWLARHWRLPERLALTIEEHHGDRLGMTALIRLADMLVHARDGRAVDLVRLSDTVAVAGVSPSQIRAIAFDAAA